MKVERFIIEYANSKIKAAENNELMNKGIRAEIIRRADRAVYMRSQGMITADEAIKLIGNFTDRNEDMSQYMTA